MDRQGADQAALLPFETVVIDKDRYGSEPSLAISPDGSIFVCSRGGPGFGSDLWASLDGGESFQYVGQRVPIPPIQVGPLSIPYGPVVRSGTGDLGGGDCDVSVDAGGRVYLVDLWVGGISVASSADRGASWRGVPISAGGTILDRPWVLGGDKDEVFITTAQPPLWWRSQNVDSPPVGSIWVARSTDGGLTFQQNVPVAGNEKRTSLNSNLARAGDHLYLMYAKETSETTLDIVVAVSDDRGKTWKEQIAATQSYFANPCFSPVLTFPVVAADEEGGVYLAWALENPETNRTDLFFTASPDHGVTWNEPVIVADRAGTRAYPWIATQGPGRVGLAWYETNATFLTKENDLSCTWEAPPDSAWHVHYAFAGGALDPQPAFTETLVQPEPIHVGQLGRYYAELFQLRFTPDGRAAIAYVADVPEGTARPMFALQEK